MLILVITQYIHIYSFIVYAYPVTNFLATGKHNAHLITNRILIMEKWAI